MPSRLVALSIDANDPHKVSRFWSGLLGWDQGDDGTTLRPNDDTGFDIRFRRTDEPKAAQNRAHFDLTSTSLEGQQQTVARALELGGRHTDVGQRPEEGHVVLADPEGNEFCVIEPGNNFLSDCGFVGALACDGSQAVGYFWSEALGWPLVWDQDPETAIRSPHGGPKITWGGPPLMPRAGRDRLHFDLTRQSAGNLDDEVERLVSIGASRTGLDPCAPGGIGMADPDGNEFCLVPSG
jgi:predicted enzyme related to lactoylglutathione lyase